MLARRVSVFIQAVALASTAASDLAIAEESAPGEIRVVEPETLNGRPKITDPKLQAAAKAFVDGVKAKLPGVRSVMSAFYGDVAAQDLVAVQGVSFAVADPAKEADQNIEGMKRKGVELLDVSSVEPGPLGGVAKCGRARIAASGQEAGAICIWADKGSTGTVHFYFKSPEEAKPEFVTIRGLVEKRS